MRLVAVILALAACTEGERALGGQCPIGEDCSPDTPAGLHFLGAGLAGALSIPPETTAVAPPPPAPRRTGTTAGERVTRLSRQRS